MFLIRWFVLCNIFLIIVSLFVRVFSPFLVSLGCCINFFIFFQIMFICCQLHIMDKLTVCLSMHETTKLYFSNKGIKFVVLANGSPSELCHPIGDKQGLYLRK